MQLVTDNPNGLSVTFTEMKGIAMGEFKKVVVPKWNDGSFFKKKHPIRVHVPVADLILNKYDYADRVELSQDENGVVSYTVCLDPKVTQGQKDFCLSGKQVSAIHKLITDAQTFIPSSNCGSGLFHAGCMDPKKFPVAEIVDRSTLVGEHAEIGRLYDESMNVLTPMATKHGGSFEFVDVYDASESPLNSAENKYLSQDKVNIGFELVVFGSCSGCTAFNLTYGQAPKKIAEILKPVNDSSTMQVRQFTQLDTKKSGQFLIFK